MMGIMNILKTPGMTSHGVVSRLRKITNIKKIGHAGTLDPQAAGVLPVCIGASTKMIPFLDHSKKSYRVEMKLGITTDTQDTTGKIISVNEIIPPIEVIKESLYQFMGEYWQVPPMYSAIKQNGKKLYELARAGKVVNREVRKKYIYDIKWIISEKDIVFFDVVCSEGTYIRTLCDDVGKIAGCGATMSFLLRTESCRMRIEDAVTLEEIEQESEWVDFLKPIEKALGHYASAAILDKDANKILNGVSVTDFTLDKPIADQMAVKVYLHGSFIGMGIIDLSQQSLSMNKLISPSINSQTD